MTYYKVGGTYWINQQVKKTIGRIDVEEVYIGKGLYNDLTLRCYMLYSEDGKLLSRINECQELEIQYECS